MSGEIKDPIQITDIDESASGTPADNGQVPPVLATPDGPAPELAAPPVAPPAPTAQQVEEWKTKAAKADEYWDRLLRMTADYENFKKRTARDRQDAIKYANSNLLEKLVAVMDHFDMAMASAGNAQANGAEAFKKGVGLIYDQLRAVLLEAGLEEINALNQTFDPNWHEAVSAHETADAPENQVVQQLRKGYKLRDRLLRPASVVVAKKPAL